MMLPLNVTNIWIAVLLGQGNKDVTDFSLKSDAICWITVYLQEFTNVLSFTHMHTHKNCLLDHLLQKLLKSLITSIRSFSLSTSESLDFKSAKSYRGNHNKEETVRHWFKSKLIMPYHGKYATWQNTPYLVSLFFNLSCLLGTLLLEFVMFIFQIINLGKNVIKCCSSILGVDCKHTNSLTHKHQPDIIFSYWARLAILL